MPEREGARRAYRLYDENRDRRNPPHGAEGHDSAFCIRCAGERTRASAAPRIRQNPDGTVTVSTPSGVDWAVVDQDEAAVPTGEMVEGDSAPMPAEASPEPRPDLGEDDEYTVDFVFPDPAPQHLPQTTGHIPHRIYRHAKSKSDLEEYVDNWKAAYFLDKPARLTIGMEVEMYIVDSSGRPMNRYETVERIIDDLPEHIWRDYYAYQLEIRTKPYKTVAGLMKNYRGFLKQSQEAFYTNGLYLLPVSYMHGWVPCGIHIHVRYDGKQLPFERAWAAYPFMLQIASAFRNSPNSGFVGGRAVESRHIGLAPRGKRQFLSGAAKYRDWHFNRTRQRHSDHPRHRMKDVNTLECRFYDTVDDQRLEQMVKAHYTLMSRIKPTDFGDRIGDDYLAEVGMTRHGVLVNHEPFNVALDLTPQEFSFLYDKAFGVGNLFQPIDWERMGSLYSDSTMQHDLRQVIDAVIQRFGGSGGRDIWLRDCRWSGDVVPRNMYTTRADGVDAQACNCGACVNRRRVNIEQYVSIGRLTIVRVRT